LTPPRSEPLLMTDILLVNPKEGSGFFEKMPPLGLASIAAYLEKNGFSVRIHDAEIESGKIEELLSEIHPRFVGISGTTHTRFESFEIARRVKRHNPDIVTVYGGVHASFTATDTLRYIPEIDYASKGEGEKTFTEFIQKHDRGENFRTVRSLAYREGSGVAENPGPSRLDLETLPRPAYHLLNMKRYSVKMEFCGQKGISLITARGCLARCSFCSASRMFDHLVTTRTSANVVDEIEFLFNEYGYTAIKIFDSTFTADRGHVTQICDEILDRKLSFPWECEIRIGTVDRQLLEKMRSAGCYYVDVGVESGSQKVLNLMRKGITVEEAEETINMCHEAGLKIKAFFSFGHIGEYPEDAEKTFQFIDRNRSKITLLACGAGVRIYPGTYLEAYARTNNFLPQDFEWNRPYHDEWLANIFQTTTIPVLLQPQLGKSELENIALRIYNQRYQGWAGFKKGLKKITDPAKLKKLPKYLKLRVRESLKPRNKP
jgi:anaerobic magnesium-protoporphyrin IX monomethyl ester cyclase